MKNTHICPKCGSDDIVRVAGDTRAYGAGNNIMIGMSIFSAINVNRYICCRCGYCEEFIDTSDLERLKNSKKAKKI